MNEYDRDYLHRIKKARTTNNENWMAILEIALKHAPLETRAVLKNIRALDLDISFYTGKIANADRG